MKIAHDQKYLLGMYTGCGRLWVTDGIWKTVFPHCMFRVEVNTLMEYVHPQLMSHNYMQNIVPGIPNLSLPDVCTASPVRGKAFCLDHCKLLEKEAPLIPQGLQEFLSYCGKQTAGEFVIDE
jgi:hypothetical protein